MMVPNQIKMQNFSPVGRGAYKAAEVDGFMQRVYSSYSELYSENAELKKKFASLRDIIEEYNAGKNAIATALVKAQAIADETVKNAKAEAETALLEAEEKAKKIVDEKTKEADSYAEEKKKAAEDSFEKAKADLERIMEQTRKESEKYIAQINEKAKEIIDDANAKAAKLVADAYGDAQKALDKKNEIIAGAQKELTSAKTELSAFKQSTLELLHSILPQIDALYIPAFEIESDEVQADVEKPTVVPQVIEEPFAAAPVTDEPDSVADIVEEDVNNDEADLNVSSDDENIHNEVKKAYIPDADEYIKQIFGDISIPHTDSTEKHSVYSPSKPDEESEDNKKNVGYNGNNTGFTVSDDLDIFTDDE